MATVTVNKPKKAMPVKKAAANTTSSKATGKGNSTLQEFFKGELKDIYWAEKHLVKTLPKMTKAATASQLKKAFTDHLETTKTHVSRLEKVFSLIGQKPQAKKCDAMAGITEEGAGIIEETKAGTSTRDVGLILAGQKVEHYEISTYGGLAQLATTLGLNEIADLLNETLSEEKEADTLLTDIAENHINYEAAEEKED